MEIADYEQSGLMSRLAGTKGDGFAIYEAEGSHRGMMAVRELAKSAYGLNFVGNSMIGRADESDPYHLGSYWLWMHGSDYRQVFLFHDGRPVAHDMLSCSHIRSMSWNWFAEYQRQDEWDTKNAVCKLDRKLDRRSIRKDCHDYIRIQSEDELAAAMRGNEYERVAAAYALDGTRCQRRAEFFERLADDDSARVRCVLAQSDFVPDHVLRRLSMDPDWRVRR